VERQRRRFMRWGRRALREPVALCGVIMGAVNTAAAFGMLDLSDHQIGVLNLAMGSLLGLFARTLVTPLARPRSRHGHALVHSVEHAHAQATLIANRPAA
jgi:hypothetical protein